MSNTENLLREVSFSYVTASGPGGQNVNKVATAVQLRFDVNHSASLTDEVKRRLRSLAGSRMTTEDVLVIEAKRYRSQEKNRADAVARLLRLIERAETPPPPRVSTAIPPGEKAGRREDKRRRGEKKKLRKTPMEWDT